LAKPRRLFVDALTITQTICNNETKIAKLNDFWTAISSHLHSLNPHPSIHPSIHQLTKTTCGQPTVFNLNFLDTISNPDQI
jgi:hypothetical protein